MKENFVRIAFPLMKIKGNFVRIAFPLNFALSESAFSRYDTNSRTAYPSIASTALPLYFHFFR